MRSERHGGVVRWRRGAVLAVVALVLAGCASMPSSGPVQPVDSSQRAEGESQVRVFGVSPEEGALPHEIVRGFLEAITSDEAEFDTATEYLTPEQRRTWDPFQGTTVLASGPHLSSPFTETAPDGSGEVMIVEVNGTQLATVDAAHVYTPVEATFSAIFTLRQVDEEWRIDDLPPGLIMGEADFRRNYRSVDAYYYADLGSEAGRVGNGENVLVADPVYVRRRIDPLTEVVASLLAGPSAWLEPVVTTAFPEGVALAEGERPAIDDSGMLTVRLTGVPRDWSRASCERMGAQLLHSVREVWTTAEVGQVRIANRAGTQLCALERGDAGMYDPGLLEGDLGQPYFIDDQGRLVAVSAGDTTIVTPVSGPLGRGDAPLRDAAVSRTEEWAAGVSEDGTALFVAALSSSDTLPEPVYTRPSTGEDDAGLTAPSWDGLGDLWVVDRDPAGQRLLRLPSGQGPPQEVPVVGLREGQRVEALRVASDGVRVAMLVREDEHTELLLGRVERTGRGEAAEVAVDGLRPVAPRLENVAAASWAGDSRLMVVGRPVDGVEQWQYVSTDGFADTTPTMPGLNDVIGVAAAEEDGRSLLAETEDGIAILEDDAQWRLVPSGHTSGPFYPG
ncbi:LpqB family beta-propeller domain-containing protein [Streptomyces sp. 4N509B]|uniref:LpqB family beta-propeller domain-containing protein n=1 Tax=Streptomyces sp. 4N509B TaxID=3457413 RepID=UPI003FD5CA02